MTNSDSKPLISESRQQDRDLLKDMPEDLRKAALDEVSSWLGRLVLLYGVPFHYLLPEEAMLPWNRGKDSGSLRFFFLDPIWIQYLVQGSCSIGNNGYGDFIIDSAMNQWVQPNQPAGKDQEGAANQKAASIRDRLRQEHEGIALPNGDTCLDWPLTGFLLRSPVVEGWRGLEILAYKFNATYQNLSEDKKKNLLDDLDENKDDLAIQTKFKENYLGLLKPLRIEQLSKDVMLGIFNGIIAQLVIRQPQEGLHFGYTPDNGSYVKTLRDLGYKNLDGAGQALPGLRINLADKKLMRDQDKQPKHPGVINIAETAKEMKKLLSEAGQLRKNVRSNEDMFTSAEFAVELIEAAGEFTYQLNIKSSPSNIEP